MGLHAPQTNTQRWCGDRKACDRRGAQRGGALVAKAEAFGQVVLHSLPWAVGFYRRLRFTEVGLNAAGRPRMTKAGVEGFAVTWTCCANWHVF